MSSLLLWDPKRGQATRADMNGLCVAALRLPCYSTPSQWKQCRASRISICAAVVTSPPAPKISKILTWQPGKRLQTQVAEITSGFTTIRSLDWDRDRFDIYVVSCLRVEGSFLFETDSSAWNRGRYFFGVAL
ncbi:hypothetical protein KP509_22G003100 [Ceratopteris richardii]|uniref:Uncharacterized protein n=1 Tax=Ceratopteris richardii TaxID=49495 RepID=A0A8T2S465_CERRI|nr:hypothetical protein KP509_22G003100 [Ceratopteris richardii]